MEIIKNTEGLYRLITENASIPTIWRGQRGLDLRSDFDKLYTGPGGSMRQDALVRQRQSYLYAAKGRLDGFDLSISEVKHLAMAKAINANHIWSLGHYYGLATPLIAWTTSPLVAAYQAIEAIMGGNEKGCIYALRYRTCRELSLKSASHKAREAKSDEALLAPFDYFSPIAPPYGKFMSQSTIFTICEDERPVDIWARYLEAEYGSKDLLVGFELDCSDMGEMLRGLSMAGVTASSLYSDMHRVTNFCNLGIRFPKYADLLIADE